MKVLQIENFTDNQSFIDNFFWPLWLAVAVGIGILVWNFLLKKNFSIKFNELFVGQHNGKSYLIVEASFINKTQDPINGLSLTTNPLLQIKKGIFTTTASGRLQGGGFLLPTVVNLLSNVILYEPLTINPLSTNDRNIVIEINPSNLSSVELIFSYLDKRIVKKIRLDSLVKRNL